MRKFIVSAALAASTLMVAAPASAQYYPQPQGNAYGYNNYGQARRLQVRIDQLQRRIVQLDRANVLSPQEAGRLRYESRNLEQRLRYAARNGLHRQESFAIERGIQRLEFRIQREARDGNRYGNGYNRYPYNANDRDRDGLNDRYERDHGTNYDEDRDPD